MRLLLGRPVLLVHDDLSEYGFVQRLGQSGAEHVDQSVFNYINAHTGYVDALYRLSAPTALANPNTDPRLGVFRA